MEIKKIIKENFVKSFIGFPIGALMLIISYVFIYFVGGKSIFKQEISALQDIHILITQIFVLGIAYYLLYMFYKNIQILNEAEYKEIQLKYPYKTVFTVILIGIVINISIFIIVTSELFSENLRVINILLVIFTLIIIGAENIVKSIKQSKIIEKINQKIKERK